MQDLSQMTVSQLYALFDLLSDDVAADEKLITAVAAELDRRETLQDVYYD